MRHRRQFLRLLASGPRRHLSTSFFARTPPFPAILASSGEHASSRRIAAAAAAAAAATVAAAAAAGTSSLVISNICTAESAPSTAILDRDVFDDYELAEELGAGAYAVVRRAKCKKTGAKVAIKVVPKTKSNVETVRREVETLRRASLHTNIAKLEAFYEDDDAFYIVMEYVSGGDVLDAVCQKGAFHERKAARLLAELGGALALLHAQGVCHADIKPENLMLTEKDHQLKLVDFGLSCEVTADRRDEKSLGTVAYWAPEVLEKDYDGSIQLPRDMWALGLVAFILLAGFHPFDAEGESDDRLIQKRIRAYSKSKQDFDTFIADVDSEGVYKAASPEARQLIGGLLRPDPEARLTIEQVLQHAWLAEEGISANPWIRGGDGTGSSTGASSYLSSSYSSSAYSSKKERREREEKLKQFRLRTAKLRAASFAVLLRQTAADRAADRAAADAVTAPEADAVPPAAAGWYYSQPSEKSGGERESPPRVPSRRRSARLRSVCTASLGMLDTSDLARAFRAFDTDGKGYISPADMERVLSELGHHPGHYHDGHHGSHGKARSGEKPGEGISPVGGDEREGQRVTYGNFIRLMTHTVRQAHLPGDLIFRQGDPVSHFYCLLDGDVDIVRPLPDGTEETVGRLHAGESFGENSLLRGAATRSCSVRCVTPVEVLQLSKRDFEAVFGAGNDGGGGASGDANIARLWRQNSEFRYKNWRSAEDDALRSRLLGFLRMVSPSTQVTLRRGENVFAEGSVADAFYILDEGTLAVESVRSSGHGGKDDEGGGGAAASASATSASAAAGAVAKTFSRDRSKKGAGRAKASVFRVEVQKLGEIYPGEGFGESSLLEGKAVRTKTVTCAADECHVVRINAKDFTRLVQKSDVIREAFQRLHSKRQLQNEYEEDPEMRKFAAR